MLFILHTVPVAFSAYSEFLRDRVTLCCSCRSCLIFKLWPESLSLERAR